MATPNNSLFLYEGETSFLYIYNTKGELEKKIEIPKSYARTIVSLDEDRHLVIPWSSSNKLKFILYDKDWQVIENSQTEHHAILTANPVTSPLVVLEERLETGEKRLQVINSRGERLHDGTYPHKVHDKETAIYGNANRFLLRASPTTTLFINAEKKTVTPIDISLGEDGTHLLENEDGTSILFSTHDGSMKGGTTVYLLSETGKVIKSLKERGGRLIKYSKKVSPYESKWRK